MSRVLLAGILAVLLALLGVMANIVAPQSKDTANQQAQAQQAAASQKKTQDDKVKIDQSILKDVMAGKKPKNLSPKMMGGRMPTPLPTKGQAQKGMQITSDWFEQRPEGQAGIEKLDKDAKANAKLPLQTMPKPKPMVGD